MERNRQLGTQAAFLNARWPRYVFPLLIGGGAFGAGILLDIALGIENRPILYSDVLSGTMAALLSFLAGRYYERLRQADTERLRVAADVNHHVRNALTTVLYSVHVKGDRELIEVTQDAVNRIDWTLREVLWETDQAPSAHTSVWRDSA
ncbi:MAG TPA: hypothetical protein VN612_09205 [Acidobacteriaceae bacterium]|nr:hypothetical protein [Acidobacteriaceae bacterium]